MAASRPCPSQHSLKNLIRNSSGEKNYDGWDTIKEGGDGWKIEKDPGGCSPVPMDEFLGVVPRRREYSCFSTSWCWCAKSYLVDLQKKLCEIEDAPFEIRCGQMYTTRFDCGGKFRWNLRLLDSSKNLLKEHEYYCELGPSPDKNSPWKRVIHVFKIKEGSRLMGKIRYLDFTHEGMDSKYWAGHFGMKFARSTVVISEIPVSRRKQGDKKRKGEIGNVEQRTTNYAEELAATAPPSHLLQPSPLECPVCLDIPRHQKVFQCKNGHIICENCLSHVSDCPQCRVAMSTENAIRNRALETVIESMSLY